MFWPFAYYDLFADVFWPYGYWPYFYDPFWYYGYQDLYACLFWPYGYDDIVGPPPVVGGGAPYGSETYAGRRYAAAPPQGYPSGAPARSTTQAVMGRYSEYCGDDSRDVAGVPVDEMAQAIDPTDEQRVALYAPGDSRLAQLSVRGKS
ncbi:MAG: hypothetical protein JO230_31040 [Xanthobacteraceae bacterium]|nr:hypothetical protein [Xanthobacteraceae bacterium]